MIARDWILLLSLSFLWGGSFFFVEIAVSALPPLSVVFLRVGLAALVLAGAISVTGVGWPRGGGVWLALGIMGLLNNVLPFALFATAQGQIDSGMAAILNASTPLWTLLVAVVVGAEARIGRARLGGLLLGVAGVAVMLGGGASSATLGAQALCLLAALSYALAGNWGRRFARLQITPLATAFGQIAASSLIMLPLVLWVDRPWQLPVPEPRIVTAILGLAVLSTALAYLLYFRLLASAGAVNLLLVTFLIPVSALALGVAFLGEVFSLRQGLGMALIGLGLLAIDGRWLRRFRRANIG